MDKLLNVVTPRKKIFNWKKKKNDGKDVIDLGGCYSGPWEDVE